MYCEECGQILGQGHAKECNTLKPGYQSFVDTIRRNLDIRTQQVGQLELQTQELREILHFCIEQGGVDLHLEDCPEDDTCDCHLAKRINKAMKGFEPVHGI